MGGYQAAGECSCWRQSGREGHGAWCAMGTQKNAVNGLKVGVMADLAHLQVCIAVPASPAAEMGAAACGWREAHRQASWPAGKRQAMAAQGKNGYHSTYLLAVLQTSTT